MRHPGEAHYYSGRTAKREVVRVHATPAGLEFRLESGERRGWAYEEIRLGGPVSSRDPIRFEHGESPCEILVVHDAAFLDVIHAVAPHTLARFPRSRVSKHPWVGTVVALAAGAAIVLFLVFRGLPSLAEFSVGVVPLSWEKRLGQLVIEQIVDPAASCADSALTRELEAILRRLESEAEDLPPGVRLHVIRAKEVNAFALPGGEILVHTGLLKSTTRPEQFAGVLAHELQHVRHRHATKAIVRRLSSWAILGLLSGNSDALSSVLQTAGELGGLAYGRDDEEEADRDGAALLTEAGIDPHGMIEFFDELDAAQGNAPVPTFLSTHPATADRILALRETISKSSATYAPIETASPWRELVLRCE